jgi:hypothetical protein
MLVTTSYAPTGELEALAKRVAEQLGSKYVPRGNSSVRKLEERYRDPGILLVTNREWRYYSGGAGPLFFHPSLSLVRVKRLMRGESDPMIEASGAKPGDAVLDCTAGLASDAIVFSYIAGQDGRVTALESEFPLYVIVKEGLASHTTQIRELDEAMRRIELKHVHHLAELRQLPDNSYDIVYFDPMFRRPVKESSGIAPLRPFANTEPLQPEAVEEAARVARRSVVLKEQVDSGEFERLGFRKQVRSGANIAYGVISL